jgi:hypothetical protein
MWITPLCPYHAPTSESACARAPQLNPSPYSDTPATEDSLTLTSLSNKLHSVRHFGTVPNSIPVAKPITADSFPSLHDS